MAAILNANLNHLNCPRVTRCHQLDSLSKKVSAFRICKTILYGIQIQVSKGAKISNRYNQVPHLIQDTNGKVTNSQ